MPETKKPLRTQVARRLELNRRAAECVPANDNAPGPDVLTRRSELAAKTAPSANYRSMTKRLAKRQAKGGDGPVPANDNEAWPLAEQLRRDGSTELLYVAERYRAIWDSAHQEVSLLGSGPSVEAMSLVQSRSFNMKTGKDRRNGLVKLSGAMPVSDGNIKYFPMRPDDQEEERPWYKTVLPMLKAGRRVPKKWTGDERIHASLDCRLQHLPRLQACLGPLLSVFEDAVLHGETLSAIGKAKGGNTVSSGPIGRAFVMDGLYLVQDEMRKMDAERKAA